MKDKQKVQEDQYFFPYHYSSLLSPHRGIPYQLINELLTKEVKYYNPKKIIDIGCGDGYFSYSNPDLDILGCDYSEKAIGFAKAFYPEGKFEVNDITLSSPGGQFDLVICQDVIEHIETNKLKYSLFNVNRCLKTGGFIVITVPTDNRPVSDKHFQHFSLKKLKEYFFHYDYVTHKNINSSNKFKNNVYRFKLWLCYVTYPLVKTKFKWIYDRLVCKCKVYYKKNLLNSEYQERTRIMAVFQKNEK